MTQRTYSTQGRLRDPAVRNHFVYRLFDADGVLMYVGCSVQPMKRIKEHKGLHGDMFARIDKVKIQGPYTYQVARQMEYGATNTENPTQNMFTPTNVSARVQRERAVKAAIRRHVDAGMDEMSAVKAAMTELGVFTGVAA